MDLVELLVKEYPGATGTVLATGGAYAGLQAYKTWLEVVELQRKLRRPIVPADTDMQLQADPLVPEGDAPAVSPQGREAVGIRRTRTRTRALAATGIAATLALAGSLLIIKGTYAGRDKEAPDLVSSSPASGERIQRSSQAVIVLDFNEPIKSCTLGDRQASITDRRASAPFSYPDTIGDFRIGWEAIDLAGNSTGHRSLSVVIVEETTTRSIVVTVGGFDFSGKNSDYYRRAELEFVLVDNNQSELARQNAIVAWNNLPPYETMPIAGTVLAVLPIDVTPDLTRVRLRISGNFRHHFNNTSVDARSANETVFTAGQLTAADQGTRPIQVIAYNAGSESQHVGVVTLNSSIERH